MSNAHVHPRRPRSAGDAGGLCHAIDTTTVAPSSLDQWLDDGRAIRHESDDSNWRMGEWFNCGLQSFSDKKKAELYDLAAQAIGISKQTIKNRASVASRVPAYLRRYGVSWSHYAQVAALAPAVQSELLEKAEQNDWSVAELRKQVVDGTRSAVHVIRCRMCGTPRQRGAACFRCDDMITQRRRDPKGGIIFRASDPKRFAADLLAQASGIYADHLTEEYLREVVAEIQKVLARRERDRQRRHPQLVESVAEAVQ